MINIDFFRSIGDCWNAIFQPIKETRFYKSIQTAMSQFVNFITQSCQSLKSRLSTNHKDQATDRTSAISTAILQPSQTDEKATQPATSPLLTILDTAPTIQSETNQSIETTGFEEKPPINDEEIDSFVQQLKPLMQFLWMMAPIICQIDLETLP
jgi:hypothetical protein